MQPRRALGHPGPTQRRPRRDVHQPEHAHPRPGDPRAAVPPHRELRGRHGALELRPTDQGVRLRHRTWLRLRSGPRPVHPRCGHPRPVRDLPAARRQPGNRRPVQHLVRLPTRRIRRLRRQVDRRRPDLERPASQAHDLGTDHYFSAIDLGETSPKWPISYYRTDRVAGENHPPAAGFGPDVATKMSDYVLAGSRATVGPYAFAVLPRFPRPTACRPASMATTAASWSTPPAEHTRSGRYPATASPTQASTKAPSMKTSSP